MCQVISAVRETSPEVKAHLATAATSLMQAAAGVLATKFPDDASARRPDGGGRPSRDSGAVEKIDLSDDSDDEVWED